MKNKILNLLYVLSLLSVTTSASAITMLIGDVDGFGYTNPNTYNASSGNGIPDTDGDGIIEAGEYLPDLDGDGYVWVNGADEFDNQSATESSSTNGAQWTDISLENNYNDFGLNPADDALFIFEFDAPELGDSDYGVDHFINFILGDYDVVPAYLTVDGVSMALTTQPGGQDGLVQLSYANVLWADMLDGQVIIDLDAPNEPYLAIDYAYLHTENTAASVPEPSTLGLLALGFLGFAFGKYKRI